MPSPTLEIHFLDLGRVDAILVGCEGEYAFIDSGTYIGGKKSVEYMHKLGITKIKYYIGTHRHANHIGGAAAIVHAMHPDEILVAHKLADIAMNKNARTASELKSISATPKRVLKVHEKFMLGGAEFECLGPLKIVQCRRGALAENYNSLILRMTYGTQQFLFTGDTSDKILQSVRRNNNLDIHAKVLKNPHHNGRLSSTMISSIIPMATIVCSSSRISAAYASILGKRGSSVYCTATDGTIVLYANKYYFQCTRHGCRLDNNWNAVFSRNLKQKFRAMSGIDVYRVQYQLYHLGHSDVQTDSKYGKVTAKAIRLFQEDNALPVTGIVDKRTWDVLFQEES